MLSTFQPPGDCPVCGSEVPARARACPHCGASERAGWDAEAAAADGLSLPDPDEPFDHAEFVRREFGGAEPGRPLPWQWILVAVVLVIVVLLVLA